MRDRKVLGALVSVALLCCSAAAQQPAPAGGQAAVWGALAQPAMDPGKAASAKDLVIQKDGIRLTLTEGTIQFTQPANGIVYGAAFRGRGRVEVTPSDPREVQQLRLFTKKDSLQMEFAEATFSFTDQTFEEVAAKVQWGAPADASLAELYADRQKYREDSGQEIVPRLLKGVLSADRKRTAFFAADLKTSDMGWLHVRFDALGPEEIAVGRWRDAGFGKVVETWLSYPANGRNTADAWKDPTAKDDFDIHSYKIDATVTGGAELSAVTRVDLKYKFGGERVILLLLDSNLRVESVKDPQGGSFEFYQPRESKDRLQSYGDYVAIVLPQPSQMGQEQSLELRYAGKRVVRKVGTGAFFAQSYGWYPTKAESFASRADFEINFRCPKKFALVATGAKQNEATGGDWRITSWKSDIPLAVAGFAYGDFKFQSEKVGEVEVQIYANREPDDFMKGIRQITEGTLPGQDTFGMPAMGSMSPAAMAKPMAIELGNTIRVFEKYFGPYPYKQLAMTNIPYPYGQGWPGLIYLSQLSFLDSTQRNALGIRDQVEISDAFRAHESSHQWWGHRVGWKSYHDQWLSEGFAEFSGNLYVQVRRGNKEYLDRLRKERDQLRGMADLKSRRMELLGPIWMGQRLSTVDSPQAYSLLVYSKGGWVLHMIRMMLWDSRSPDPEARFITMMQDFTRTYDNKPASTEDFKAIVEKYMTPAMDVDGNRRMDWFFNQYVYGTGFPEYTYAWSVQDAGGGKWKVSGTVNRTGAPDGWKDILPLYLHQGQNSRRIGFITVTQQQTTFELPPLGFKPDRVSLSLNEDTLPEVKPQ